MPPGYTQTFPNASMHCSLLAVAPVVPCRRLSCTSPAQWHAVGAAPGCGAHRLKQRRALRELRRLVRRRPRCRRLLHCALSVQDEHVRRPHALFGYPCSRWWCRSCTSRHLCIGHRAQQHRSSSCGVHTRTQTRGWHRRRHLNAAEQPQHVRGCHNSAPDGAITIVPLPSATWMDIPPPVPETHPCL